MKMNKKLLFLIILLLGIVFLSTKTAISSESEFKLRKEVLKFIPYESLNDLLTANKKLVYMPYQELKKLIQEKLQPETPAPVDYVIKGIALTGTIKEDFISFEGNYKIDLLNKKWIEVPILSTNTGIKQVVFDAKPANLISDSRYFKVITDEIGEHNLKINFDVKSKKFGNNNTVDFLLPNASIASIDLTNGTEPVVNNNSGRVEIKWKSSVGSKIQPIVRKVKKETAANVPAKVIANINTLVSIDEGLLQGFSGYALKIYHNSIEKLTFQIPEDIEILDVSSPQNIINKGNYKIDGKTLTVYLNSKVKDSANINISYEKTFENKKIELNMPNIFPIGSEISKASGYFAVQTSGNSEIKTIKTENISRVDIGDLPGEITSIAEYPIIAAYSFLKSDFSLVNEVTPHKDAPVQVAIADNMRADSRLSPNGVLTSKVDYTVRNMSEQFFKFNLPENAEILTAAIDGQTQQVEKQDSQDKKDTVYLINIKRHQDTNPFNLTVMYRQKLKMNNFFTKFNLDLPLVLNMPVLTTSWAVYVPEGLQYWNFTDLNKGENYYLRYLPQQTQRHNYDKYEEKVQTQIASNLYAEDEMVDSDKVTGVLPPEFTMPPVKGLKKLNFSGYLTDAEFINVSMIGVTIVLYYLIFLVAGYFIWTKRKYLLKVANGLRQK